MPSPFDMITHSPIMQLANLARAVCASWKVATTAIPTIRRRKTVTPTPTLSPATLT